VPKISHLVPSSWTPNFDIAHEFKDLYNGHDSDAEVKRQGGKPAGVVSAWVHEENIKFVPKQYGTINDHNDNQHGQKNDFAGEHEIIVAQNHQSEMVHKDHLPELIGKDKKGKLAPANIDQQITARHAHNELGGKKFARQYASRRRPVAKSDPMGMNSALNKSNYGKFKGGSQYVAADNVRRKQGNANEVITAPGNVKIKTGANASGGQGKQRLNQQMKEIAAKNLLLTCLAVVKGSTRLVKPLSALAYIG